MKPILPKEHPLKRKLRLWTKDPTLDEYRSWVLAALFLGLITVSCGIVHYLEFFKISGHLIDYSSITLADISAGALLMVFLERRISGREHRFNDERNLNFAVRGVTFKLNKLAANMVQPQPFKTDIENQDICAELHEMLQDPDQWRFYGSESLHLALDNFLRNLTDNPHENAGSALEVISHAAQLGLSPHKERLRLTRSSILIGQPMLLQTMTFAADNIGKPGTRPK